MNSSSAWEDRAILRSPLIDLPKDTSKFLLTARIKTENVAPGHVLFRIKYFDENGEQLLLRGHGTDTFYKSGPNNHKWEFVKILLNPPHWDSPNYPENARAEIDRLTEKGILMVSITSINDAMSLALVPRNVTLMQ